MEATMLDQGVVPKTNNPKGKALAAEWMAGLPQLGVETPAATPPAASPETPAAPVATPPPAAATPPAAPAKPAETEEEKWPRSADDWTKFKEKRKAKEAELTTERDTIKSERDKLNAEIADLKKAGPSPELDSLKKERDDLSERLRMADIEKHPKFKAYYDNKIGAQVELAKRIVGTEKSEQISKLLALPDSDFRSQRIDELVLELSPMQQSRIGSVLNSIEEIHTERNGEIARANQDYEKITTAQRQAAENAQKEGHEKAVQTFDFIVKSAQDPKDGLMTFQKRDGDEEWNKGINARIESAKELLFGKTAPEVMIQAAMRAVSLPAVLASHKALHEENSKLKEQVAALSAATPKTAGNGGAAPGGGAQAPADPRKARGIAPVRQIAIDWMADLHETQRKLMSQTE